MNKETLPKMGVSETLRMSRERAGQDLRYVADMLRIRYAYLEAIENGEYQKLPGATYAIGFVRAYADHLNLNSVEIVERFKQERADLDQQTQLVFPKPLPEGKVPSGGILLVAVVLGVFVYGAWFFLSGQDKPIVELIPEIPARLMALVGVGEDEPADAGTAEDDAGAGQTMATAPSDEEAVDEEAAETPIADAPDGQAQPETATTAADDSAEEPAEPAVPAQSDRAVEGPATADMAAPETEETAASPGEPPSVPATETDAETAELQVAPAAPAAEPEAEEPAAVAEAVEAEDMSGAAAETDVSPEPAAAGDTDASAAAQETDTATATEPTDSELQAPAAGGPTDEDSAAAIAQRALQELGQSADRPADADDTAASRPQPTAVSRADDEATTLPGARVNGDPAAAETRTEQPSDDGSVAAMTPAGRTPEAPAPADTPAAAPDNGTGSATLSIMPARPGGKVYGTENEESRILITARVDSWVEVSTQQGDLLLTRVLRAGDSFRVPDQAGLSLVTGNAGGLAISVDGRQVPDLGPVGAVRRGVELDPDSLKAGTAGNL